MQRRAFTVVELMVAVVVLLAVIVATSKIFNTASKVSSLGEATADVLGQATVIQEQLGRDIDRITGDGFIAIQCVAVRNDVNQVVAGPAAPLLNPQLPANAVIRCDQITFFTAGDEVSARWAGSGDMVSTGGGQQARAARVSYGHGVQLPGLGNDPRQTGSPQTKPVITGIIPAPGSGGRQLTPWTWLDPGSYRVGYQYSTTNQDSAGAPRISPNQPEARQWVLARKSTLLADDGGDMMFYPEVPASASALAASLGPTSAPSIFGDRNYTNPSGWPAVDLPSMYQEFRDRNWVPLSGNMCPSPILQSGWVDVAASDLDKVRRAIAPTLRLSNPVSLPPGPPNGPTIDSVSTPWTQTSAGGAPRGWPTGAGAPAWPSTGAIVGTNFGQTGTPGAVGGYSSQRDRIMRGCFGIPASGTIPTGSPFYGMLGWPRAEKAVPSMDRRSQILTSPVLTTNCSHFQIDWTWEPFTGRQTDSTGALLTVTDNLVIGGAPNYAVSTNFVLAMRGFEPDASGNWASSALGPPRTARPQPWFGFPDTGDGNVVPLPAQRLGVTIAQDASAMPIWQETNNAVNTTNAHMRFVAQSIEGIPGNSFCPTISAPFGSAIPVRVYTAVFGFNQDEAFVVTPDGIRVQRDDYTPWPTQLRITCTLHDPRLVLDRGRDFQFIVDLPKRKKK
ncbi:MAG: hypothetical protein U0625_10635 [Phycisphaerales bacterium]